MTDGHQPAAEIFKLLRGRIEHEDNLINQRMTWLINAQAFFFGVLGIIGGVSENYGSVLTISIELLGFIIAISSFVGIKNAGDAVAELATWWWRYREENLIDPK